MRANPWRWLSLSLASRFLLFSPLRDSHDPVGDTWWGGCSRDSDVSREPVALRSCELLARLMATAIASHILKKHDAATIAKIALDMEGPSFPVRGSRGSSSDSPTLRIYVMA